MRAVSPRRIRLVTLFNCYNFVTLYALLLVSKRVVLLVRQGKVNKMFEATSRVKHSGSRGKGAYKVIWNKTDWFEYSFTPETNQYLQELVNLRKKLSEGKGKTQEQHEEWKGRTGTIEAILGEWHKVRATEWDCKCGKYC
jgi:hypothetical protein